MTKDEMLTLVASFKEATEEASGEYASEADWNRQEKAEAALRAAIEQMFATSPEPPADRKSALDEIVRISEEAGLYGDPAAAVNICQGCRRPVSVCMCASLLNRPAEPR